MKVSVSMPFDTITPGEFLTAEAVVEVSQAVERAGFAGAAVTDHPCPTGRWLDNGGHHAQDPFVMLSLIGAATRHLKLHTAIIVVPYRNPFLVARAISTLDVCTGGRTMVGLGAGYSKGEFFALGADFENRNDVMDEYIGAMKTAWATEEFSFAGSGYDARGSRILPLPLQRPHPPLWIGGNSKRAIRRAVELGDYWYPFQTDSAGAATVTRTSEVAGVADLGSLKAYMVEQCERLERSRPLHMGLSCSAARQPGWTPQSVLDELGDCARLGVDWVILSVSGETRHAWCDNIARIGNDVLPHLSGRKPVTT